MGFPLFLADVFTKAPFAGNPASVCLVTEPRSDQWMQHVAREMNLSETAFVSQQADGFHLRWFTPLLEVDLCGHATLASAHILWEAGYLNQERSVHFQTRSGIMTVQQTQIEEAPLELDFPAKSVEAAEPFSDLKKALHVPVVSTWKAKNGIYLIETDTEQTVRTMRPDIRALAQLPIRSVILTSRSSTPGYDFVSRYFAPRLGIDEDPVTGFAHCYLGPFWSQQLNKTHLLAYQASERGGLLHLRVLEGHLYLSGQVTTIFRGELLA